MRRVDNFKDVQIILNELLNWKAQMETRLFDMHGRRITNLGAAVELTDAVNLNQVQDLIIKAIK